MASTNQWVSTSAPYLHSRAPDTGDAWAEEAAQQEARGTQRLITAGPTQPPAAVGRALNLRDGELAIVRRRVIYLDAKPTELADTYYPACIADGTPLAQPKKIPGGAVTLMAQLGHNASRVREDITARMPSDAEHAALELENQEPVIVLTRLTLDSGGRPIQVDVMTMPAAQRLLRYELKVD